MRFHIKPQYPYSLRLTALSHGWVKLAPYGWDDSRDVLERIEAIEDKTVHCWVSQDAEGELTIAVDEAEDLMRRSKDKLKKQFERALSVSVNLADFRRKALLNNETGIVELIDSGGGRLLRGTSLLEDAIKTVFTCNASWGYSRLMATDACGRYGSRCVHCELRSFPSLHDWPKSIKMNAGYRRRTLEELIRNYPVLEELERAGDLGGLRTALRGIKGIGPYSESHIMCLAGDYSCIPVDREVANYLGYEYSRRAVNLIQDVYRGDWGPWSFLAYKAKRMVAKENWIG